MLLSERTNLSTHTQTHTQTYTKTQTHRYTHKDRHRDTHTHRHTQSLQQILSETELRSAEIWKALPDQGRNCGFRSKRVSEAGRCWVNKQEPQPSQSLKYGKEFSAYWSLSHTWIRWPMNRAMLDSQHLWGARWSPTRSGPGSLIGFKTVTSPYSLSLPWKLNIVASFLLSGI